MAFATLFFKPNNTMKYKVYYRNLCSNVVNTMIVEGKNRHEAITTALQLLYKTLSKFIKIERLK